MKLLFASSLVATLVLTGCGGSSNSGTTEGGSTGGGTGGGGSSDLDLRITNPTTELAGSFRYYAYFDLDSDDLLERVNYEANFLEMVDVQAASVFENGVPPAIDSCNMRVTDTIPSDVGLIGFPDAQFNLVSAGESFTLTGDSGTYATIVRSESRFDIAPHPIPEPLTLDIPGDVFPAVADLAVPNVVAIEGLSPSGNSSTVDRNTVFTWTPSGIAGNSVYISTFDFPATGRVVDLLCRMADDGEFQLPDDIVTALTDTVGTDFTLTGVSQLTRAFNVVVQGDTLVVVTKENRR
ncbi:MAG: hypothetical protein AB8B79_15095 [Granulosicoccus sp.]